MKVTISRKIKHALLIDEAELKLLQEFISTKYKNVEVIAKCIDGTRLETSNIDEVIAYENSNSRKIKSLNFEASNSIKERLSIDIESSFFTSGELNIKSDSDEEAVLIVDKVLKRLHEMNPWYDYLAKFPATTIIGVILFLLSFVLQSFKWLGYIQSSKPEMLTIDFFNFSFYIVTIFLGFVLIIEWLQKQLFPKVFFLIGKQKKFMESVKFWRNILFGVILLGIVINVFSNWISK